MLIIHRVTNKFIVYKVVPCIRGLTVTSMGVMIKGAGLIVVDAVSVAYQYSPSSLMSTRYLSNTVEFHYVIRHRYWLPWFSCMMMSSHGNAFCVIGPLCGPVTGGFSSQRASSMKLWCFLVHLNKQLGKLWSCQWFEIPWQSCDVILTWLHIGLQISISVCRCHLTSVENPHDDVIKWKHFPHYWPFVRGIHRPPVNSPHKGQWRRAWVNNQEAGYLRHQHPHYDVTIMWG